MKVTISARVDDNKEYDIGWTTADTVSEMDQALANLMRELADEFERKARGE